DDGDYRGEFTKDGFSEDLGNPFSRVSSSATAQVNTQLKPWGALRGRVADEEGRREASVRVEKSPNPRSNLEPETVTDENGDFAFLNLAPGSYTLIAKPTPKIVTTEGVRMGTVPTYYPSAVEPEQATRIQV